MLYSRPRRYQVRRQYRLLDYLMPFLIIIAVGVILLLVFNLWRTIFSPKTTKAAYMHILEGNVQMKTWGTDKYFALNSDSLIISGDSIQTSAGSKVIVEFFDGTIMRIDGGSDIVFDSVEAESDNPEISIELLEGRVWFNKLYKNTKETSILVKNGDTVVHDDFAGIFEVENDEDEVVRVFRGFENQGVIVDINSRDQDKVVESQKIGIGQQGVFSKEVLDSYLNHRSPTVVTPIDDAFKNSSWYVFNIDQDSEPVEIRKEVDSNILGFKKAEPEVIGEKERDSTSGNSDIVTPDKNIGGQLVEVAKPEEKPVIESASVSILKKPVISSVASIKEPDAAGIFQVTSRVATLTGTVSEVEKVVVNGYTLQKFKPGDGSWSYFANADFGLMKAGENVYEIYSIDAGGNKSETLVVKVFYTPAKLDQPPAKTTEPEVAKQPESDTAPVSPAGETLAD